MVEMQAYFRIKYHTSQIDVMVFSPVTKSDCRFDLASFANTHTITLMSTVSLIKTALGRYANNKSNVMGESLILI